ncbi:hypothetical protein H632_c287p2, partial [Helicosporidium sp. ATCC 50920]
RHSSLRQSLLCAELYNSSTRKKTGDSRRWTHRQLPGSQTLTSSLPFLFRQIVKEPCGTKHIAIVALRDIARGEELCYDYQMEFEPEGPVLACACGAPSCRGRMN